MELGTYILALGRIFIAACSRPFQRDLSLIGTFETTFLMPNYRPKTKRHWAPSPALPITQSPPQSGGVGSFGLETVDRVADAVVFDSESQARIGFAAVFFRTNVVVASDSSTATSVIAEVAASVLQPCSASCAIPCPSRQKEPASNASGVPRYQCVRVCICPFLAQQDSSSIDAESGPHRCGGAAAISHLGVR